MSHPSLSMPVDVNQIMQMLPHRYPFLLVDRVIDIEPNVKLRALKNVSFNEPYFQGHFPGQPVMPGVLIIEAMAQASGLLTQLSQDPPGLKQTLFYLVKVDNARFTKPVIPGDQLILESRLKRMLRRMGMYECSAYVDGVEVASADVLCAEPSA